LVAVLVFVSLANLASAQQASTQTTASNPQALAFLQKSLAALTGGQSLTDVTLSGTARRIAGSDNDTGPAVFKALAPGASRIDLSLSSGPRWELANATTATPVGAWSGPDGISHAMVFHNLLTEPAWFFPAFAIARRLLDPSFAVTYIGQETRNGQAVEHISVSQSSCLPDPPGGVSFAHLTKLDFYLDSITLLPAAIAFNIHPDNNALLDLPVEIDFSDYRVVALASSSSRVPFHIQKLLNNTLILDFQAHSFTPNSGLSASIFSAL